MKWPLPLRRAPAFTLTELLVVLTVTLVLAGIAVPMLAAAKRNARSAYCYSTLRSLGTAFRLWAGDSGGTNGFYPGQVSTNAGGALELLARGEVLRVFDVMSNEINTPKILLCPADSRQAAATFGTLQNSNLSYFVGRDANDDHPNRLVMGDRNLEFAGQPVPVGQFALTTNLPVRWSSALHRTGGNVSLADGSAHQLSSARLQPFLVSRRVATNRIVIP